MEVITTMAYWIHESGNKNNSMWKFFMCDYITDIKNLPTITSVGKAQQDDTISQNRCSPGSKCLCLEDGSIWLIGKDTNKWIKIKNAFPSGGSSGEVQNIEPILPSSIESLF